MSGKSKAKETVGKPGLDLAMRTIQIPKLASLLGKSEFARRWGKSPQMVDYLVGRRKLKFIMTANGRLFFPEDVERLRREREQRHVQKAEAAIET